MPGLRVDGNNVLETYAAAQVAIERARSGNGPTLIEAMTYRFHGHIFGDADAYMNPKRKEAAIAADPVPLFREWLIAKGHADESEISTMEALIAAEIDEAITYALSSDFPDVAELQRDVFAEEPA